LSYANFGVGAKAPTPVNQQPVTNINMRIIGGVNKGSRLKAPKKGIKLTKGIAREAIFNIIGRRILNAQVLDVFAGSGAVGLEAIARGAKRVVFIEKKPGILYENIARLSFQNSCYIINRDFRPGLKKLLNEKFDIIFMDPPYHKNFIPKTLELIQHLHLIQENGLIIAEHSTREDFTIPDEFHIIQKYHYGNTTVSFIAPIKDNYQVKL